MRVDAAPFKDNRVRQAMRLIVDRQQMIDQALNGYGVLGNDMYSPFDEAYASDLPQREQDIDQAKSLLKQAGQEDLEVELVTSSAVGGGGVESANLFVEQARKAGVKVRLNKADPNTSETVAWASEFFRDSGKTVITMDHEVPGFIANRLQEALWREALHMIAAGEATVEQIDVSITDGPGLRWPIHGPMLTFHLAGGQGGMAHMLDHFGPSLKSPWTRLEAAELTPQLRDAVVAGVDDEAAGRTIDQLIDERDSGIIAILRALGRV